MPRPRPNGNGNITVWFVGAAYMPPVAAIPTTQLNGQTARDAYMRPLQTCRYFPAIAKIYGCRKSPRPTLHFLFFDHKARQRGGVRPIGELAHQHGVLRQRQAAEKRQRRLLFAVTDDLAAVQHGSQHAARL